MFFQRSEIFIVEDEVIIAEDLAGSLKEMGHEVVGIADNSDQAIQSIRESGPQVVILDIHINGTKDGIELGQIIRDEFKLPIIYISAYIDIETRRRAQRTNPVSFLSKPFDDKEVEVAIKFALGKGNKLAAQRKNDS
jgi:two-component system, LytTR family, response regulator LytT